MTPCQLTPNQKAMIRANQTMVPAMGDGGRVTNQPKSNISAFYFDGPELADLIFVLHQRAELA